MGEMSLMEHLEELRIRIIKTLCAFVVLLIVSFIFVQDIYQWLVKDLDGKLAVLGPSEILWIYMVIAFVFALAFTLPVAAYQVFRFVSPGLKKEEYKVLITFIPFFFLLFVSGLGFGYFVLFPMVLAFLTGLSNDQFSLMFTAEHYFRFMLNLCLPFGFLFEMPLVVLFLTRLGVLNPLRLARARKLSYFALIVISVLITPPDFISDILVIVPLLLLYELSVTISRVVYKKRLGNESIA
ncbi:MULTISPECIES: twin-arginine translocase subunit TatC [Priestia]|uniref:twin-arginine translocase subunit TatC n=1 Tax=Priestia TaxID=2800373 RepID=UPI001ADAF60B|nr:MULTISPECIES: twin-arginine translocase subunit TatC [Priestia]QTL49427.1 twin-arginine translocase subunit TatC [Priestia aryabhattai]USL42384.1 twin-arginine translocase subunit TatC [Priestia megaterium]